LEFFNRYKKEAKLPAFENKKSEAERSVACLKDAVGPVS
jgi:hypothetical protein